MILSLNSDSDGWIDSFWILFTVQILSETCVLHPSRNDDYTATVHEHCEQSAGAPTKCNLQYLLG